jgi:tRNA(Ile)-lysidine synthetase-like protein
MSSPLGTLVGTEVLLAVGRHPLAAAVTESLRERCHAPDRARLLVGVSGGADSTALLLLLRALSERATPPCAVPVALHVDHGLREDSAAEAEHVRRLCAELEVRCEVVRLDLGSSASDLASRARRGRYDALQRSAVTLGLDGVAVAHHAEDRLETMLQALCRGTGPQGMASPRWVRSLGDTTLLRPLLGCSRASLVGLCEQVRVPWLNDPTNERLDTPRGLLRAKVLDVLEERWPGAALRASAAADRFAVAADAIESELDLRFGPAERVEWPRASLIGLDVELLSAGLRRALLDRAPELDDALPATLLGRVARAVRDDDVQPRVFHLVAGWRVEVDGSTVRVVAGGHSEGG